ncbi:LLM class flavin-dependent oxidoreductase [Streptomyces afghaniensis]|uniref:LLM class flavin-dependent oxidoreductase n=1 Tax=Streptomyces afghaniensis TaxID=66865 RepID=UPI0027804FAB|nr:LLM class flavin-dependent oxidoreductase [Streptomyces afghaniensis]MDQ1018105.1 5,10-methylenetetrahydromethanopterin reductase [Streptomyces afghaniensis]
MSDTPSRPGQVSAFFPIMPVRADTIEDFAELVCDTSLARLWMGQSLTYDTYHLYAYLAGRGLRVPTGTAVSVMALRHPYEAAVQARSVSLLTGRPMTVGFGMGSPEIVDSLRGSAYASPLGATREYLSMVRALVNGEFVESSGSYHSLKGALPPMPSGHPPISVAAGVLRAGMARVVGEVADAAITWLTPMEYVQDVLIPALSEGAGSQDRAMPRVVSMVHFAVERHGQDPRDIVLAANREHLKTKHYTTMLRKAGLKADPSDPEGGAAALVEAEVFLTGSAKAIALRIAEYLRSGIDEVVLSPGGVLLSHGVREAITDLREVVAELESLDG